MEKLYYSDHNRTRIQFCFQRQLVAKGSDDTVQWIAVLTLIYPGFHRKLMAMSQKPVGFIVQLWDVLICSVGPQLQI